MGPPVDQIGGLKKYDTIDVVNGWSHNAPMSVGVWTSDKYTLSVYIITWIDPYIYSVCRLKGGGAAQMGLFFGMKTLDMSLLFK